VGFCLHLKQQHSRPNKEKINVAWYKLGTRCSKFGCKALDPKENWV